MSPRVARDEAVERLARSFSEHEIRGADLAFVLGSGLGALSNRLANARAIAFEALDGMPKSTVVGHAGRFVIGELAGVRVVVQQGRVHLYEGRTAEEVTRTVRAFAVIGVRAVVLTNAAGGLRREWSPGTLMRIVDHVNLQGRTPLAAHESGATEVWDRELGEALDQAARDASIELERGVYVALPGPSYETPAEIRHLAALGADAVGMSTVLEALAARARGLRVVGLSLISNHAAGLSAEPLAHDEVVAAGAAASDRIATLFERAVPRIANAAR